MNAGVILSIWVGTGDTQGEALGVADAPGMNLVGVEGKTRVVTGASTSGTDGVTEGTGA